MALLDSEPESRRLRIHLLGRFHVVVDGRDVPDEAWRRSKAATVIKLLALAPHHRLHREQIMDLLWPGSAPASAVNNLHQALHLARRVLDPDRSSDTPFARLDHEMVSLAPGSEVWVDVDVFEAMAARARSDRDLERYQAAVRLYTGDLLPDDVYHEWAAQRRAALRSDYLRVHAELAQLAEARGDVDTAIRSYEETVRVDATREDAHVQLMRLYARFGRRNDALRQYELLEQVLRDDLGVEPEPGTRRLHGDILKGTDSSSDGYPNQVSLLGGGEMSSAAGSSLGELPQQVNRFVGRSRDVSDLQRMLRSARVITLTGTGGCGKTRLAIELGHTMQCDFSGGAWLVELAGIGDPLIVPHAVASTLRVTERSDQPLAETLASHIGSRDMVLVLDNCEHLIGAAAALTNYLVRTCPSLRMLITSREPLHIAGEVVWRVSSLSLPNPDDLPDTTALAGIEAVDLFLDRAQAVLPEFELTAANAAAIARICYRLDGMPLAIELAAARVSVLSVDHILTLLDDCFTLLTSRSRTALSRQQTLKALLDWSYDLLTEEERSLFRRLAVFAGGFSFEAAEAVGGGRMLDALSGLVDKSLVQADRQGEEVRYRLLEPVRQYANLHLIASGEAHDTERAHADWYCTLAQQADSGLWGTEHRRWIEQIERERDNLSAILGRCVHGELDVDTGLRLVDLLWQFWLLAGYLTEGRRWLGALLARNPQASKQKAVAILHAFGLALRQGDYVRQTTELIDQSSAIYSDLGDEAGQIRAARAHGIHGYMNGEYDIAEAHFQECERRATLSALEGERALAVHEQGIVAWARGEYGEGSVLLQRSHTLFEVIDAGMDLRAPFLNVPLVEAPFHGESDVLTIQEETWTMLRRLTPPVAAALTLVHLGTIARLAGETQEAHQYITSAIERLRLLGDTSGLSQALAQLGNLFRAEGQFDAARDALYQSLSLRRELGDRRGMGRSLNNLGVLALYAGDARGAHALFEESMALFESMKDRPGIAATSENQGFEALFDGHWVEARLAFQRGVALAHAMGTLKRERAMDLRHIGLAARGEGDEEGARAAFEASRVLFLELRNQRSVAVVDRLLGSSRTPEIAGHSAISAE